MGTAGGIDCDRGLICESIRSPDADWRKFKGWDSIAHPPSSK